MSITKLLERHGYKQVSLSRSEDVGAGRTAELRRKFASRLAELSEVRLRPPILPSVDARITSSLMPYAWPEEARELYSVSDGESSTGFFAPELEFLRAEYSMKLFAANREAIEMGLLPAELRSMLPIFRDSVGNQLVVPLVDPSKDPKKGVLFVSMESASVWQVSKCLTFLVTRLLRMKDCNAAAGRIVCPGDFRSLNGLEAAVATEVER